VQLSRGKAEAQVLFESALLMHGPRAALPADLLLFYTQEFAFVHAAGRFHHRLVDHAAEAQSGRVRAGPRPHGASAQACARRGARRSSAKLPSGYQRDLQLIKPPRVPRHRSRASSAAASWPSALDGVRFRAEQIKLDPAIHAAEEANALVAREGIPFREAYRRIGEKYPADRTPRAWVRSPGSAWRSGSANPGIEDVGREPGGSVSRRTSASRSRRWATITSAGRCLVAPRAARWASCTWRRVAGTGRDARQRRRQFARSIDAVPLPRPGNQRRSIIARVGRDRHRDGAHRCTLAPRSHVWSIEFRDPAERLVWQFRV
jgi:hypothetical protein